jgi:nucleotide-binding universal stress UspA family protein
MTVHRILVGLDGSLAAHRAAQWSDELARALGAEIVAVHALGLTDTDQTGTRVMTGSHRGDVLAAFDEVWCAPFANGPTPVRQVARDGEPAEVLLAAARSEVVDLIVLGSRGTGGVPQRGLGSTSSRVAESAEVPVVIVPFHGPPTD